MISEKQRESESPRRYFDEEWPKEEHITAISMKQSISNKADRQEREKNTIYNTQETCVDYINTNTVKGNRIKK